MSIMHYLYTPYSLADVLYRIGPSKIYLGPSKKKKNSLVAGGRFELPTFGL